MELHEIRTLVDSDNYDFLRKEMHLGDNIMLLTVDGSHAYGTNVPTSDVDIRGVALQQRSDLLGMSNFEQFENTDTDTVIYGFNKYIKLISSCNPNCIEALGMPEEYYLYKNKYGQMLIDNAHMFLSKECIRSFGGYATAQLRRLENALARDNYPTLEKEKHILGSVTSMMDSLYEDTDESVTFAIDPKTEKLNAYFLKDFHCPVRELNNMMSQMTNIVRDYEKINHRNRKKDDAHLNKHAMHLLRLLDMGIDILEKEVVITRRDAEHDLLMDIRNGVFMGKDGTMKAEFWELLNCTQERFDYAAEHTSLPKKPDFKQIEEFVMEVNNSVVLKNIN